MIMWATRPELATLPGHEPAGHQAQKRLADLGAEIQESHAQDPGARARCLKLHAILGSPSLDV